MFELSRSSTAAWEEQREEEAFAELYHHNANTHLKPHSSSSMLRQGAPPFLHASTPTSLQQESIGLLLMRHTHTHAVVVCL